MRWKKLSVVFRFLLFAFISKNEKNRVKLFWIYAFNIPTYIIIIWNRLVCDKATIEKDSFTLNNQGSKGAETDTSQPYDSELYVDKLTGVYLSGTRHEEDQPCHLKVLDMAA